MVSWKSFGNFSHNPNWHTCENITCLAEVIQQQVYTEMIHNEKCWLGQVALYDMRSENELGLFTHLLVMVAYGLAYWHMY